MSRASQNRHQESKAKKAASARPSDGNGQSGSATALAPPADPGAFDAALDAFVTRAQREFGPAQPGGGQIGKGTYHPAPSNLPVRLLVLGLIIGLSAGLLLALALR